MSTNNKEMRRFALVISVITAISLALSACSGSSYTTDAQPKTSKFLFEKFNKGQYLDAFEADKPEIGITLEAMTQLSAFGYDKDKQAKAISWAKANTALLTSPGLKATYIFTAHALGFADDPTVSTQLDELKAAIDSEGGFGDGGNFAFGWVVLALMAGDEKELGNRVAVKLSSLSEATGGYRYTQGEAESAETADVTGFALLAIQATLGTGSSEDEAAKVFAIGKAKSWLLSNLVAGDHWVSFGDIDISGTAYGIMALTAVNENVDAELLALEKYLNPVDGGIIAPWTTPDSDTFSTGQSLLALSKLNFLDVLKHKVN